MEISDRWKWRIVRTIYKLGKFARKSARSSFCAVLSLYSLISLNRNGSQCSAQIWKIFKNGIFFSDGDLLETTVEIYSCYWRSGGKSGAGYLFSITPMTPTLWQPPTQMRKHTQTQAKTKQIRSQWESCFKPLWWNIRQILDVNMFKNRRKPLSWTEIQINFSTKFV